MKYDLWFYVTNCATILAQLAICAALFRSEKLRAWQGLFLLCGFDALAQTLQMSLQSSYKAYFYVYWSSRILESVLQAYLLADIMTNLPDFDAISRRIRFVAALGSAFIAAGAGALTWHPGMALGSNIVHWATLVSRTADITWGCFAVSALVATVLLGMTWRVQALRVISAYLVLMLVRLAASYAYVLHGRLLHTLASQAEAAAWAVVCAYWLSAILRQNPSVVLTPDQIGTIQQQLHQHTSPSPHPRSKAFKHA